MKNKIVCILIMTLLIVSGITVASPTLDEIDSIPLKNSRQSESNTLITDSENDRVIEVDSGGSIVWEKTGLDWPIDAERLDNGNTLITEGNATIIEVDSSGTIVWEKTELSFPGDAERLENGNTLITEREWGASRVIEVDSGGSIVWEKTGLAGPVDAERLDNGNTLITEVNLNRVIEVDSGGSIVWEKTDLNNPWDAERIVGVEPSEVIIDEIRGGFRVSAIIKNIGTGTATDIEWSIDLSGGLIIFGKHYNGVIASLAPDETKTVRQTFLFGIGWTTITVQAGEATKTANGFVLGPLVLGIT